MAEANDFSLNEEIQRILGPSVANEAALPYHSGVERVPEEAGIGDAPVVRVLNTIINQAIRDRASDIHIEPMKGQLRIRFRIDGLLHEKTFLSPSVLPPLVTRIKILASLDIAEKRLPQDGRFHAKSDKGEVDLRISTLPTVFGEKVVIRILSKSPELLQMGRLGYNQANLMRLSEIIRYSCGMILITGPTGSGKTTTLYALINQLNNSERNIVSIEEPVEYVMPGVNQTQVNNKTGLSFAAGLRSILRQDPNIIIVGEIRDLETANIAAKAGNSGHLVLSTLHTNDAPGAIARLVDMGVEPYVVASSVVGVVCQRLVRVLCPGCKEPYQLETRGMERDFSGIPKGQDVILYRPRGCPACRHIGYQGRTCIQEILPVSNTIRQMIKNRASELEIKLQGIAEGMKTIKKDGLERAIEGVTSIGEVMRVAFSEEEN
ncbi:GspE/PulE family protein [Desulforamulus aquiferis]|uniref:GspE/PulE family protein n=1 Tax=Desulforamulus aquiferis TaxID=1397668 RepID=A0AAW7ZHD5_9FIRM|nr:GspE/PulE family protein [Desulforamulus aquiferis]MDO7788665.1 GspE/PulE family protein [Desulforamulus aquiferis]